MEEAAKMMAASEGKDACCKSTEGHMVMKGETGCCSAKGEVAKFKVFVLGTGYKFFGCEDSAKKGRNDLAASGAKVGNVQKVRSRVVIN